MPEHPTALVTGATGAIGPVLVQALLAQGQRVSVMSRRPIPAGLFPPTVEVHTGDITDPSAVERAVAGASVVFHLAAKLHVASPADQMRAEYERVNVEGTRTVAEAARASGARRLVFFSTVSVYGPTGAEPVDETAPTRPDTLYAETKLRAEEICLSATTSATAPLAVVLRMAAVYGPRVKGNYARLVRALARGRFVPVGRGDNLRTLVYERDAVRAAVLASRHPAGAGRVYNVSDGEVHRVSEIISAISATLGRRPPRLSLPLGGARLAATMADRALTLCGHRSQLLPAVDKYVETVAVRADRIQRELGFAPEYDLHRGWQETIAALRGART